MSGSYYIGPFGRILPIVDGQERERQQLPIDETRTNMTSYQLPPPDRLQFGTDARPSFSEPTKYNTIGQLSLAPPSGSPVYSEDYRQNQEQLPSVRHLLTPASQPSSPPSPHNTQQDPSRKQHQHVLQSRPFTLPPGDKIVHPNQSLTDSQIPFQPHYTQPQVLPQYQPPITANSQREPYPVGPFAQQGTPFYGQHPGPGVPYPRTSLDSDSQTSYQSQSQSQPLPQLDAGQNQYTAPSNPSQAQQMHPMNVAQPQQILSAEATYRLYHNQTNDYQSTDPEMNSKQSLPAVANTVKPQPRVVGERDVPGEGPSWLYEDGTTCKKIIDGEAVNAQWGITKAGKPRKRLAIACTTCREKKIKCDPAEPKCVQCEKFGRECRFTTAFRNQRGSPDSPSHDFQARHPLVNIKSETPPCPSKLSTILNSPEPEDKKVVKRRNSSPEASHDRPAAQHDTKPITDIPPPSKPLLAKRQRSSFPGPLASKVDRKIRSLKTAQTAPESRSTLPHWEQPPANGSSHTFTWANDPYIVDKELTSRCIDDYFTYINSATNRMFPRRPFLNWVQHSGPKTPGELMVLYAMLTVGSVFLDEPERTQKGSIFIKIARSAIEQSQEDFTLQLIHSRLLLSFYHYSLNEPQKAWDVAGAAIRAASGLNYHLEGECKDNFEGGESDYGLGRNALAECRRRSFWAAFMIDIFGGCFYGHTRMLQAEDIYLRLPYEDNIYEDQSHVETPFFSNGVVDEDLCRALQSTVLSSMAFCVSISSIWGDIFYNITRSSRYAQLKYQTSAELFYVDYNDRLSSWLRGLPAHWTNNRSNIARCVADRSIGAFVNLHALYHVAIIRMNRGVRYSLLPASVYERNIMEAFDHAQRLLRLIKLIGEITHEAKAFCVAEDHQQCSLEYTFSTPFVGYAALTAVDVLSSGGRLESCADVMSLIDAGLSLLKALSPAWGAAVRQSKGIAWRKDTLSRCFDSSHTTNKKVWKCNKPLDPNFPKNQDVLYDIDNARRKTLFTTLGVDVHEDEILVTE